MQLANYPDVLGVDELSCLLRISSKTVYKLLREEKIKSLKVGKAYRVPKLFLLQYLGISRILQSC